MGLKDKLAPFGSLNMMTGLLTVIFGISFETSDFIVDCLEQWRDDNKKQYCHINLDNGPQNSSHRTQFMKRMIEFADKNNLEIMLAFTRLTTVNITPSNVAGEYLKIIGASRF